MRRGCLKTVPAHNKDCVSTNLPTVHGLDCCSVACYWLVVVQVCLALHLLMGLCSVLWHVFDL